MNEELVTFIIIGAAATGIIYFLWKRQQQASVSPGALAYSVDTTNPESFTGAGVSVGTVGWFGNT